MKEVFKSKIDYTLCAITGIDGLNPTIKIIKHTKKIAIANKESIICGWNLIKRNLNNTIETIAYGETKLLVRTENGKKEKQNRRAELYLK